MSDSNKAEDIDHAEVERLFRTVNFALAGERTELVLCALKDLVCATCCVGGDDVAESIDVARRFQTDLEATIRKNFSFYRAQLGNSPDAPPGHG